MRRYLRRLPALLLGLATVPLALTACDMLKPKGSDAGLDAAALIAQVAVEAGAAAPVTAATATAAAPLGGGATPTPITPTPVHPAAADAGPHADAGVADAAHPGPVPTPMPTVPPNFLDAGGVLRNFDAGGFKPPWQH